VKVERADEMTGRRAKRWLKKQVSRMRRRMERQGREPRRLRDLTRGWWT
jgi:hypothetical protein